MAKNSFITFDTDSARQLDEAIGAMLEEIRGNSDLTVVYMQRVEPVNMFFSLDLVKTITDGISRIREIDENAGASLESRFNAIAREMIISHTQNGRLWREPLDTDRKQILHSFHQEIQAVADLVGGE